MESCSRIKDGNERLAQGEEEVRKIWKKNFEDLYNIYILRKILQYTCVASMGFGEVTTLEESQLEELRLRREWLSSRMERPLVWMRSQEK